MLLYSLPKRMTLREKCSYSEFFRSAFSRIWTEYGEILRISPYSVRMRGNTDQKNSEDGHFSSSVKPRVFFAFATQRKIMNFFVLRPLKKNRPTKQLYVQAKLQENHFINWLCSKLKVKTP